MSSFHLGKTPADEIREGGLLYQAFSAGHFGVHLFFAISGFILSLPFAKYYCGKGERMGLRAYFIRRITRIEPPYIIHLAFLFVVSALVLRRLPSHPHLYHNPQWASYVSMRLLSSLVYVNGFIFAGHPYPNVVLWSLEVEVQFYILAPFLARVFAIQPAWKRRGLLISLIILAPLATRYWGADSYIVNFSLLGNIQYFLVGFLLVDFYLAGWLDASAPGLKWDIVFPFAGLAAVFINTDATWEILLPWVILLACWAAFRGKLTARFLSNPWITTVGGMCYTIYLYHAFIISALVRKTAVLQTKILWLDWIIQFSILFPAVILICSVLFFLFERPFMQKDWPAKFWAAIRSRL